MINKFKIIVMLTGLLLIKCVLPANKYVIGSNKGWGFFASFFAMLDHIAFCEQNNKTPVIYWSNDCAYFNENGYNNSKNAWEYYFNPVSNMSYQSGDKINRQYFKFHPCKEIPAIFYKGMRVSGSFEERYKVNSLIEKYIEIKPNIKRKINQFFKENIKGKKTIGIHLRGTDKPSEFAYPSAERLLKKANEFKGYQYFIATDEEQLLNLAKKTLNGKVIAYDSIRSSNGKPVHFYSYDKAKAGEDILIEVMLLSKCTKFIHTESNVSMAVLCFNPDLKNIPMRK